MVTEEQIAQLEAFCNKHYVRYYDVRMELIDHLANAIEERRSENPGLSFEAALEEVYSEFGKTGFRSIIVAKEAAMAQEHKRYYHKQFRSFFSLPKILFTLCCIALIFTLEQYSQSDLVLRRYFLSAFYAIVILIEVAIPIYLYYRYPHPKQQLICRQVLKPYYFFVPYSIFSIQLILADTGSDSAAWLVSSTGFWVLSLLSVLFLLSLLAHKEVCEQIYSRAKEQYPLAYA